MPEASITQILPPSASNTRPVASHSADPSQTTRGETFSGAIASKTPSSGAAIVAAKTCSVMRVRAAGAIALTPTPYRPSSAAATRVRPTLSPAVHPEARRR